MKRFVIQRHPTFVTAAELHAKGSIPITNAILRFSSMDDLIAHFTKLGVPTYVLGAALDRVDSTGTTTLAFLEQWRR